MGVFCKEGFARFCLLSLFLLFGLSGALTGRREWIAFAACDGSLCLRLDIVNDAALGDVEIAICGAVALPVCMHAICIGGHVRIGIDKAVDGLS